MLILANGAFKSGSTWLRAIVDEMVECELLPVEFQNSYNPRLLDPIKLKPFINTVDLGKANYVLKSHLFTPFYRDVVLSNGRVSVLNIQRDLRDVLVSHYHHLVREGKVRSDFHRYYWFIGRYKACQLMRYHTVWDVDSPQIYTSSFEALKTDFDTEVARIGEFLGVNLSKQDIDRIRSQTSLEQMRQKWGESSKDEQERFFRKGAIGEWQDYFTPDELNDVSKLQTEGLSWIDKIKYQLLFELRPELKIRLRSHAPALHRLIHRKL